MRTGTVLALLLVSLTGCDYYDLVDVYWCPDPDKGHKDANGQPDPCHRHDPAAADGGSPADAGEPCPGDGQCVPRAREPWSEPVILWTGPEANAPHCPAGAIFETYTGYADLDAPTSCGACKCDSPIGSCALPAKVTAAAASCAGDGSGVTHTSFDPPTKWEGSCTAANSIPPAKLCDGVPCVQSITIAPLTMTQGGCVPIEPVNVQVLPISPERGELTSRCDHQRPRKPATSRRDHGRPRRPATSHRSERRDHLHSRRSLTSPTDHSAITADRRLR